ncbi:uncharacterized protein LOC125759936 [Rhipicephalus sanguineus]|uniref:uncharacterized protein LOC125759936 n=1 Tax=Rhipicephalus sanguineus TaxID=34632 RepID=UPI0020C48A8A|nr:uncharacterized protein LOC125759936 [Rhipicephalus sanguineus]
MAVDEQLPRYSQIAGGSYKVHPETNQAGASQENVSDDLQIWVIVTPEEGPMPTTPGGSHDTAQPGAISATNQQRSAGLRIAGGTYPDNNKFSSSETAGGTLDEPYIELPCLVLLPSDNNTENGSTGVQLPKSSNVEEAFPSTSGEDMVVLLVTDMKISDGKGNGDQNTTNYQDGGTAVHYVTPHESLSHNNEPPALHSEKTQTAKKETSLPLPVSSSGACDDAVPSTSRADKNAAALATNNASRARAQRASANAGSRETASTPGKFRGESSASSRRSTRSTSQATTASASPCERPATTCRTRPRKSAEASDQRQGALANHKLCLCIFTTEEFTWAADLKTHNSRVPAEDAD